MNYGQVDIAIDFLMANNENFIVIQVPYYNDIGLVKKYIIEKYGLPTTNKINELVFYDKIVKFETTITTQTGFGYKPNQLFFIDRRNDFSYYKYLDVMSE